MMMMKMTKIMMSRFGNRKTDYTTEMKNFLLVSFIILSGCSQNIGNLSIVSTQPTNISNEYESIGLIRGENTIFVVDANKMPRINYPIQNALINSGADLITNATFELETYLWYKKIIVTGEGWVKKKEGNNIETQREKKIIEYDPATGEPIYE
jgi:hypothetical protein